MDLSAAILNVITMLIGIVLAGTTWKIGRKTGFLEYWRLVAAGMGFMAIARFILALAEGIPLSPIITVYGEDLGLRDVGLCVIILATILMLMGFQGLLKAIVKATQHGS